MLYHSLLHNLSNLHCIKTGKRRFVMEHYNIHFSPTGGTKKVAGSLGGNDICLVSVPSYGGRVPVTAIEKI